MWSYKHLTAVGRVQQDGGLAHDPALVAREGNAREAVVDACIVLQCMHNAF